ncbi:hypothetical protein [uncultured Roseobacter sp.]|uniref:hypothetical protein n=1 Tax=uncultured Roseobacter sp. TaxID=114847 RepID=UPI0026103A8D|nr:hypothetical protein [uncultured Roseobacter sp.]
MNKMHTSQNWSSYSSSKWILRPLECLLLALSLAIYAPREVSADHAADIERMFSWNERGGMNLEGLKTVTAILEACKLQIETTFSFPNPVSHGLKRKVVTIDLARVETVEQSEYLGRYLIELYPHGYGSIFRARRDLNVQTTRENWGGERSKSVEDVSLNLFVPTPGRDRAAEVLQNYTRTNCPERE